ncbi:MAG: hypothetical protein AB7G48_02915 [Nitrospiraceae bacterium]
MAPIYQSGAFIQQCFAVHPLCLTVKRLEHGERLLLGCTSCHLTHRIGLRTVVARLSAVPTESGEAPPVGSERTAAAALADCAAQHAPALSVRRLETVEDLMGLRCSECRRVYELHVQTFETHQR